ATPDKEPRARAAAKRDAKTSSGRVIQGGRVKAASQRVMKPAAAELYDPRLGEVREAVHVVVLWVSALEKAAQYYEAPLAFVLCIAACDFVAQDKPRAGPERFRGADLNCPPGAEAVFQEPTFDRNRRPAPEKKLPCRAVGHRHRPRLGGHVVGDQRIGASDRIRSVRPWGRPLPAKLRHLGKPESQRHEHNSKRPCRHAAFSQGEQVRQRMVTPGHGPFLPRNGQTVPVKEKLSRIYSVNESGNL